MKYEIVIGLEVHVELSTKTKIFCGCTTEFGGAPNTHCCPVCTGMPGSLPVLNKSVIEYAVKAGLALGCDISRYTKFDRKNYFYPDLPKAYQISQLYEPICQNGLVELDLGERKKQIRIHEIHLEEDAGKLIHDPWISETKTDYNRCGVPLIEIVSEADFRGGDDFDIAGEVVAYLEKLRLTLQYLDVSDCKMQEGSMRADINLSVRPASQAELGTRTEMKNMASLKAIKRAIEFEAKRQIEVLEEGGRIVQETRRWDENKDASYAMRAKENAQDYRYFPEPDIPPVIISDEWLEDIKSSIPELAGAKVRRYISDFGLPEYDCRMITADKALARFFEAVTDICGQPKEASNWIMGELMRKLKDAAVEPNDMRLTPENMAEIITLVSEGKVNRQRARDVFLAAFEGQVDVERFIKTHGMEQVGDESIIVDAALKVFENNLKSVQDYKSGKEKAFGFLVGQTMRELKGKADPGAVNRILREKLGD